MYLKTPLAGKCYHKNDDLHFSYTLNSVQQQFCNNNKNNCKTVYFMNLKRISGQVLRTSLILLRSTLTHSPLRLHTRLVMSNHWPVTQ